MSGCDAIPILSGRKTVFSRSLVAVFVSLSFPWFPWIPTCEAGSYTASAHGQNVSRTETANLGYATGNCAHCHELHASVAGSGGSPSSYLGFAGEETLCYGCHGFGGAGTATDNVEADITKTYGHDGSNSAGLHRSNETQAAITASKHIECTDCHNPHRAGSTIHSEGTDTIATNSPLYEAMGVEPTFSGSNWTAPIGYSALQTATKEYQICFKCHSGAVGDPVTWSGTSGLGAQEWTDVGLEFSDANRSGHPIVTGLENYSNSITVYRSGVPQKGLHNETDGNTWDQLLDPWGTNVGYQTMYCSDCHISNSSTAGPHGSSYKWMLGGTNKAWPFTTAAKNGASTGTYRLIDTLFEWSGYYQQGLGTDDGCFCWNCHPANRNGNNVHMNGNHSGGYCVDCHIRVPHGGKVSRLIAAENAAAYSNLPSRYTADGAGRNTGGTTEPVVRKFTKAANWSYGRSKCYSSYIGSGGCTYHNSASYGDESW